MLEIPEAVVIAEQINQALAGKWVTFAEASHSPHKFAWYTGDPANYNQLLEGKTIRQATAIAGVVEIQVDDRRLQISTAMQYHQPGEKLPKKHQLLLQLDDGSAFTCTVQMWGCMLCLGEEESDEFYDMVAAKSKPSPLSDAFDRAYFDSLFDADTPRLSAKEFLATKQRIPGLGNGVLQDILWAARIHPKRKMAALPVEEVRAMFTAVKGVLHDMAECGGRDTERDLFGNLGGYKTVLSKNTVGQPCPACGSAIRKEAYLGGSIYYCEGCQKLGI